MSSRTRIKLMGSHGTPEQLCRERHVRGAVIVHVEVAVFPVRIEDADLDHCAFSSVGPEAKRRRIARGAGRHIITAYLTLAPAAA